MTKSLPDLWLGKIWEPIFILWLLNILPFSFSILAPSSFTLHHIPSGCLLGFPEPGPSCGAPNTPSHGPHTSPLGSQIHLAVLSTFWPLCPFVFCFFLVCSVALSGLRWVSVCVNLLSLSQPRHQVTHQRGSTPEAI